MTLFHQSIKHRKSVFYCFSHVNSISYSKWRSLSHALHFDKTLRTFWEHSRNVKNTRLRLVFSTFLSFSQMSVVFYNSVIHGLGFICYYNAIFGWLSVLEMYTQQHCHYLTVAGDNHMILHVCRYLFALEPPGKPFLNPKLVEKPKPGESFTKGSTLLVLPLPLLLLFADNRNIIYNYYSNRHPCRQSPLLCSPSKREAKKGNYLILEKYSWEYTIWLRINNYHRWQILSLFPNNSGTFSKWYLCNRCYYSYACSQSFSLFTAAWRWG